MAYAQPPAKSTLKLTPFKAATSDQAIQDLQTLIKLAPLGPHTYENSQSDARYGVNYDFMSKARDRWLNGYDWRKAEARINSFPNFTTQIESEGQTYTVQFLALFSSSARAVPITFLHGWPGSILEFLDLLDVLKSKYPDPASLPYHVIVPSLPGYGYSSGPPLDRDWAVEDMAAILNKLMVGLGFGDGYVAQGGDIGSFTSRELAASHVACKAIHLNFCSMPKPKAVQEGEESEAELKGLKRYHDFTTVGNAYAREHGTRPSTIGFVLSSSPIALFAWISEKFLQWSDVDPPLDQILDSVTLYWFTQSFPRSIYPYRGQFVRGERDLISPSSKHHLTKPIGYSWFPLELMPIPVSWVRHTGNLVWYKHHSEGGHFAAMEKPELLLQDVEDFVQDAWPGASKL